MTESISWNSFSFSFVDKTAITLLIRLKTQYILSHRFLRNSFVEFLHPSYKCFWLFGILHQDVGWFVSSELVWIELIVVKIEN